jgi:hypothetical protein
MSHTFIATIVTLVTSLMVSTTACADQQRRSFYDRNGHFVGSQVQTSPNSSSFYDGRGHFSGSSSGRSFYDRNGHFMGSTK